MEHEHEVVAAPSPAAPVAATPAAVGAGPALLGALSPARVIALQRTIGNRATSAILARAPAAGAGDFGVAGGVPVSSGTVTAAKEGADKVKIKAPTVTMDGSAWLKQDRELGSTAYAAARLAVRRACTIRSPTRTSAARSTPRRRTST